MDKLVAAGTVEVGVEVDIESTQEAVLAADTGVVDIDDKDNIAHVSEHPLLFLPPHEQEAKKVLQPHPLCQHPFLSLLPYPSDSDSPFHAQYSSQQTRTAVRLHHEHHHRHPYHSGDYHRDE